MDIRFIVNDFQNCPSDKKKYISFEEWDVLPQDLIISDLTTTHTSRYRDFGLIDHILLEISSKSATFLGLWILGCHYQKRYDQYNLKITNKESDVKIISLMLKDFSNIKVQMQNFEWTPECIDDFEEPFYFNEKPNIKFTTTEDQYTVQSHNNRDCLEIISGLGGACALAEFFLNFGHSISSNTNYEYLKEIYSSDFLGRNSCEMRVHKIDAKKYSIFEEKT